MKNKENAILSNIGPMMTRNNLGKVVCRHPWTSFDIYPDGNVTPCCYLPRAVMGNVNNSSIADIWNGEKFKEFRSQMSVRGADGLCSFCPVRAGMNHWEDLSWYAGLSHNSDVFKNAQLNEQEIWQGKTFLKSKIRRLKYTPRYTCNLNCYHCCQDQYRLHGFEELDKSVLDRAVKLLPKLQIINPFGGEPFLFKETYSLMQAMLDINPDCQLYTTTNANYFTSQTIDYLNRVNIGKIAVSFDGCTKETYEKYRQGGSWELLIKNIEVLAKIRERKPFTFVFNVSFNSKTFQELPIFIGLCKKYQAIGKPVLLQRKENHSFKFWREHIKMSRKDIKKFSYLVAYCLKDNSLPIDTRNSLLKMKRDLRRYLSNEIKLFKLNAKIFLANILKRIGLHKTYQKIFKNYA